MNNAQIKDLAKYLNDNWPWYLEFDSYEFIGVDKEALVDVITGYFENERRQQD